MRYDDDQPEIDDPDPDDPLPAALLRCGFDGAAHIVDGIPLDTDPLSQLLAREAVAVVEGWRARLSRPRMDAVFGRLWISCPLQLRVPLGVRPPELHEAPRLVRRLLGVFLRDHPGADPVTLHAPPLAMHCDLGGRPETNGFETWKVDAIDDEGPANSRCPRCRAQWRQRPPARPGPRPCESCGADFPRPADPPF